MAANPAVPGNQANPPQANALSDRLKIARPAFFDGKRENFASFITDVQMYLIGTDPTATDAMKILFTLSYMKEGLALKWRDQFMREEVAKPADQKTSWVNFIQALEQTFTDAHAQENARAKLHGYKQKYKETADEFFVEFERLALEAGYAMASTYLVEILQDNIKSSIIDTIWASGTIPADYAAWKIRIILIDAAHRQREERRKVQWKPPIPKPNLTTQNTLPKPRIPTRDTGYTGVPGEPMQGIERRAAPGGQMKKCYRCGKPGHFARDHDMNPGKIRAQELQDKIEELQSQIRQLTVGQDDEKKDEKKEEKDDEKDFS